MTNKRLGLIHFYSKVWTTRTRKSKFHIFNIKHQSYIHCSIKVLMATLIFSVFFSHLSYTNISALRSVEAPRRRYYTPNIWLSSLITLQIYLRGRARSYFTLIDNRDSESVIVRHSDLMHLLIFTNCVFVWVRIRISDIFTCIYKMLQNRKDNPCTKWRLYIFKASQMCEYNNFLVDRMSRK